MCSSGSFATVYRLVGLVVKAPASRAVDPGFEPHLRRDFSRSSHTGYKKLALQWLPCVAPGVIGSVLGLGGPKPVYCDWAWGKVWSTTSVAVWQHVKLSEQIRPQHVAGTLSNQPTNNIATAATCSSCVHAWGHSQVHLCQDQEHGAWDRNCVIDGCVCVIDGCVCIIDGYVCVIDGYVCVTDGCVCVIDGYVCVTDGCVCVIDGCVCVIDGCVCIIDGYVCVIDGYVCVTDGCVCVIDGCVCVIDAVSVW